MCTTALSFLEICQERRMYNFSSPVKLRKCTYDYIGLTWRIAYQDIILFHFL